MPKCEFGSSMSLSGFSMDVIPHCMSCSWETGSQSSRGSLLSDRSVESHCFKMCSISSVNISAREGNPRALLIEKHAVAIGSLRSGLVAANSMSLKKPLRARIVSWAYFTTSAMIAIVVDSMDFRKPIMAARSC